MPPRTRQLVVPSLLRVGSGCLDEVAALLADHRFELERPVIVGCGSGPSRSFAARVVSGLRGAGIETIEVCGLEGRLDQAAAAAASIIEEDVGTAVAVGGGRVLDPLKFAAARTGIDFVSVPTTLSNDGISSPIASLTDRHGTRTTYPARMPFGVVVDLEAVGSAPRPTLRAGVGDLVSNLTACLDWRLADRLGHDRFDPYSAMIAESAARPVLDLVDVESADAHEVLAHGLILSGLAMEAAGTSRPCSGAEHLVSHALDAGLEERAALHGSQVALGTLIAAAAHSPSLLEELRPLFARLGLPTCPEDLGVERELAIDIVAGAPAVRPERWTILSRYESRAEVAELLDQAFSPPPGRRPFGPAERRTRPQPSRRSATRVLALPSSSGENVSVNSA
jgi:glycerol-1-phosphate dehydrogenase [NAD(P)+]